MVKPMKLLVLIACSVFSISCVAVNKEDKVTPQTRCEFATNTTGYIVPIRGTGYYWIEYLHRGLPEGKRAILLIQSTEPHFADRASASNEPLRCGDQKILDVLWLTKNNKNSHPAFDCQIADDMPYKSGELVFGFVDKQSVGLHKSETSWKAIVKPMGKGGRIEKVDSSLRAYCTVLPGIDAIR